MLWAVSIWSIGIKEVVPGHIPGVEKLQEMATRREMQCCNGHQNTPAMKLEIIVMFQKYSSELSSCCE